MQKIAKQGSEKLPPCFFVYPHIFNYIFYYMYRKIQNPNNKEEIKMYRKYGTGNSEDVDDDMSVSNADGC